eukprot:TRINITY_DN36974_c0_g1_i1.p1 TRINITY_DN36974_c0_g1~~TRINITY_DN36974_c0_g1_i1.p1  ORF type:complete len:440 (+),score=74.72 TRINITY_DN36974_c0_g1_i1:67-1386(+)
MGRSADAVSNIIRQLPLCDVEAKYGCDGDISLVASQAVTRGETVIRVPFECCLTSSDLDGHSFSQHLPPDDAFSRLLVSLLLLMQKDEELLRQPKKDWGRIAEYFRVIVPEDHFDQSMMVRWYNEDDEEPMLVRLSNSIAWKRARAAQSEHTIEHAALANAGLQISVGQYCWAKLLLQTRAIKTSRSVGHILCPVIDLANHVSTPPVARFVAGDTALELVADFSVDVGDAVSICYDPDADFLDLFERYGFYDSSSQIHTAEVAVPLSRILQAVADDPLRASLVKALSKDGYDEVFEAWWVPKIAAERCPLMAAIRATLTTDEELTRHVSCDEAAEHDVAWLKDPIALESDAKRKFAEIITAHLHEYGTSLLDDTKDMKTFRANEDSIAVAALRLLAFEKSLLQEAVQMSLLTEPAQSQHQSRSRCWQRPQDPWLVAVTA